MTPDAHAAGSLSLDRLFEIVSRESRRRILDAMREESPRTVEELTRLVRFDGRDRDSVEVTLCHNHLPRLDSTGIVRWDRDAGMVERGPQFEEVAPFLELMADNEEALPTGWP